jgi:ADP-ribose pyrophosphatase YjhB (NUDIX family)
MERPRVSFLEPDLYKTIESSVPIVYVDAVLVDPRTGHIGLIRRASPYGSVWCQVGGRVFRGETIRSALRRHIESTLAGLVIDLPPDPQPHHVYQWFPEEMQPREPIQFGQDSRKHAVAMVFLVQVTGEPNVILGGEAEEFGFFEPTRLPAPLWPGCEALLTILTSGRDSLAD